MLNEEDMQEIDRIKPYRHENPDAHIGFYYFALLD
jgi:hypothetical protein